MNISGIRPEAGFYDYNSIKYRPEVTAAAASSEASSLLAENGSFGQVDDSVELSEEGIAKARAGQTFGAYDFAAQYRPGETFDMKGSQSDIKSLDVEKAVSDMQKDSLLQQYQYFVGGSVNVTAATSQGTEDFSL